jgi:hypothetical protein
MPRTRRSDEEGRLDIVVFYTTSGPNSGSLRMPTMTSRPGTIGWTSKPLTPRRAHNRAHRARAWTRTGRHAAALSDRLSVQADHEASSHHAEAETGDLRKDEPLPVCLFSSARKFLDDLPVDRGLSVHEALELERITQGATPSTVFGTGLSAVPDSP